MDQVEIYWNTAFLTEGKPDFFNRVVVKRSGKLLQTGPFCVSVCLVDGRKASLTPIWTVLGSVK